MSELFENFKKGREEIYEKKSENKGPYFIATK
jgi:hypothetical protein